MAEFRDPADAQSRAAPSWRALALLLTLVLAAHWLALVRAPARFSTAPDIDEPVKAMVTRRIEATPPPLPPPPITQPAPPIVAARKPAPRPRVTAPPPTPAPVLSSDSSPSPVTSAPPDVNLPPASGDTPAPTPPAVEPPVVVASAPVTVASAPATPSDPPPTPVTSMDLPGSVKLDYKVTGGSKGLTYYASAELGWNTTGASYDARIVVSALFLGSRSMASTGAVGPGGLAPTRFSDKSRSEVAAHFEPDKGQITFSANTPPAKWLQGAQDRVSVFMQMTGMLAGNPALFPVGSTITMLTVGPRSADTWTFLVEGNETLQLPFGELPTLKLSRQPRREFDQKVEIWFAPSLLYLPVRTRITQANGDYIDQQLTGVSRP